MNIHIHSKQDTIYRELSMKVCTTLFNGHNIIFVDIINKRQCNADVFILDEVDVNMEWFNGLVILLNITPTCTKGYDYVFTNTIRDAKKLQLEMGTLYGNYIPHTVLLVPPRKKTKLLTKAFMDSKKVDLSGIEVSPVPISLESSLEVLQECSVVVSDNETICLLAVSQLCYVINVSGNKISLPNIINTTLDKVHVYLNKQLTVDSKEITRLTSILHTKKLSNIVTFSNKRKHIHIQASFDELIEQLVYVYTKKLKYNPFNVFRKVSTEDANFIIGHACFEITSTSYNIYYPNMVNKYIQDTTKLKEIITTIYNDHLNKTLQHRRLINIDYMQQQTYSNVHRSGWEYCIKHMKIISSENGLLCDVYLDRTFHVHKHVLLERGIIPYTCPWIGFLHHTFNVEHSSNNLTNMFNDRDFIRSLESCVALICLSNYLREQVIIRLKKLNLNAKVISLYHPTMFVTTTFKVFKNGIVGIGAWYRNPFTINRLLLPYKKYVLIGKDMESYCPPMNIIIDSKHFDDNNVSMWEKYMYSWIKERNMFKDEYKSTIPESFSFDINSSLTCSYSRFLQSKVKEWITSVTYINRQEDNQYDEILSSYVVFLNLVDCSAVNTLIECIVRNTPVVVNSLPAIVEYIGKDYPLLYDNVEDVGSLLSLENISKAFNYIRNLNKDKLSIETFLSELQKELTQVLREKLLIV